MASWLLWGVLSYLCYALSTSLDKHFMNKKYDPISINTFKMFFDGFFLLFMGAVFFELHFTFSLLWWALPLGILYAVSSIFYFKALQLRDIGVLIPYTQSLQLFLIFTGSLLFLGEHARMWNYTGMILIVAGMYAVTSADGFSFPHLDRGIRLITIQAILTATYSLLVKNALSDIEPINLALVMYFVAAFLMFAYAWHRRTTEKTLLLELKSSRIVISAVFGALGTILVLRPLNYET